jgi:hypothetical protein
MFEGILRRFADVAEHHLMRLLTAKAYESDLDFGNQMSFALPAGPPIEQHIVDAMSRRGVGQLWRVSMFSLQNPTAGVPDLRARLMYGTSSSIQIDNLSLPLVAYVPGNLQLYVRKAATGEVPREVVVSLKPVSGYGQQILRSVVDASGGALTLAPSAVRFTALVASTVQGVALAPGESMIVTAPAGLNIGGGGIVEHEL